ncbi:MAG: GAF domain-containing protein [Raineya sp.]
MKNLKIRHIAYFFGVILVLLTLLNYLVVSVLAIKPKQTQIIGYTLQMREIANQLKLTLTILANQDFYNEALADDIRRLEASYNTRFSVLENGGEVEQYGQKIIIPEPDEASKVLLEKIRRQWSTYAQDVSLVIEKLTKGKSTDTLKLDKKFVADKYKIFVNTHDQLTTMYQERLESQYAKLNWAFVFLGMVNFTIIASIYYAVRNLILIPIHLISKSSRQLALGNLSEQIPYNSRNEIGYIAQNINDLAEILRQATEFSREIGKGNLEAEYKGKLSVLENKESIVAALQMMRQQLIEVSNKDNQERWVSTGIAEFSEMLRGLDTRDLQGMCYGIISFIVKYLGANQGIMFVLNDDIPNINEHYLEPMAGYAANKRKIFKQKIKLGETLIGQSFRDKETILLDEVPDTYEKITSAMGNTTPRNVLIVPFAYQEVTLGVVEILSLKTIPSYQVSFVEKLTEIFASSIANAKAYDKSQKLFMESLEVEKRISRRG